MTLRSAPEPDREPLEPEQINALWNEKRREMREHAIEAMSMPFTIRKMVLGGTLTRYDLRHVVAEAERMASHWSSIALWADEIDAEVRRMGRHKA